MKKSEFLNGDAFRHSALAEAVRYDATENNLEYTEEPNVGFYACDVTRITSKMVTFEVQPGEGPLKCISLFIASLQKIKL